MTIAVPAPSSAAQPESSPRQVKPYYVNAWVDGFFIGGASILTFALMAIGGELSLWSTDRTALVISYGIALSWAINWPHFAATGYRLYRSKEMTSQYPVTSFGVPILLVPATIAALAMPTTFAPWFVKLFMLWSPYHFSGQTIGITMLYARRAGFNVTPIMRWSLTWFVMSTYIGLQAQFETAGVVQSFYGITGIPTIGLPPEFAGYAHLATIGLGIVLILATYEANFGFAGRFPLIIAVPVVTQWVWFKYAVGLDTHSFLEFVPLFHSIQYLFIAWFMQMKERQIARDAHGSGSVVAVETIIWAAAIFVVGGIMFSWGPQLVALLFPVSGLVAIGVLQSTIQIHHFFVDGVIWKLKNPRIRAALNTSIDELIGGGPK